MSASVTVAARQIVVVIGAGPGTGFAVARKFAQAGHPVALLSRTLANLEPLAKQINDETKDANRAKPFSADVTQQASVSKAVGDAAKAWGHDAFIYGGVFNPTAFLLAPILDVKEEQLRHQLDTQVVGFLHFAQSIIRGIQQRPDWQKPFPGDAPSAPSGVLLVTGATASVKGSANFGGFAAGKFGLRGLSQSIAREYGPQGIHTTHFIIDGVINTERVSRLIGPEPSEGKYMDPAAIAEAYFSVASQPRSAWASELDLRPHGEKW